MKKIFVVVNPRSGRAKAKSVIFKIITELSKIGRVTVYPTKEKEQTIQEVTVACQEYDIIVACGGDGTLNEVVNGVMKSQSRPQIGFIPFGTTNDFASSLDISFNCSKAVNEIVNGQAFSYDIGNLNGNHFTYVASTGAFAEVAFNTSQNMKNALGHLAYIMEGIRSLTAIEKIKATITMPNRIVHSDLMMCVVMNTKILAGLVHLPENEVRFDDGMFELLCIEMPQDLIELSTIISSLLSSNLKNPHTKLYHAKEFEIHTENPSVWTIDGENGGEFTDVKITVENEAVDIILKNKKQITEK